MKATIIEGNSNNKDDVRVFMVKGEKGNNGVSPIIELERENKTVTIRVTDAEGIKETDVEDGVSPIVTPTESTGKVVISITDIDGTRNTTISDPVITTSKSNGVTTISITDKNGTRTANINDGETYEVPAGGVIGFEGNTIPAGYVEDTDDYNIGTKGVVWKEDGYGDKFRIIPAFAGTDDDNVLKIQSTTGGLGTDPTNWTDLAIIHADTGKIDLTSDTGWLNLPMVSPATSGNSNVSGYEAQYRKINNIVYLRGLIIFNQTGSWGLTVAQLPEGFRPSHELDFCGKSYNTSAHSTFAIATNGSILYLENTSGASPASNGMFIECSFIADN